MRGRLYIIGVGITLWLANGACAEDWPQRPVKVVAPVGPGGYTDTIARLTTDRLSREFGVRFIVENRAGGGGALGTEYVIHSLPDGYTLWFGGGAQFSIAPLIKKLPYDPIKSLTPISLFSINGLGLVVSPDLPVRNLAEFIAYVKARPGKLNYAVSGIGQSTHLAAALWAAREKLDMVMVPYPSVPTAALGLMSGEVQMYFGNMIDLIANVQADKMRLLAVSAEKRLRQFPDVPAISEQLPNFVFTSWVGYFAPVGTPAPVVDKLSTSLSAMCREQDVMKLLYDRGMECVGSSPAELAAAIQADLPIARAAVEAAGLSAQ